MSCRTIGISTYQSCYGNIEQQLKYGCSANCLSCVWKGGSDAHGVLDAQSLCHVDDLYDRRGCTQQNIRQDDVVRETQNYSRIPSRGAEEGEKVWHDRHICHKEFQPGVLLLLYDNKFMKHLRKLHMQQLGPF